MRIGIDIKAFSHNTTGIARYLRELLNALQYLDHENDYFLFECRRTGYGIINTRWKKITSNWFLPGVLWQQVVLPFLIKKQAIEVFWAPEQICPVFFMKKVKIITTIHDCVAIHFPKTAQWSVALINKLLLNRSLSASHCLVTVSDFIRKDILQSYGSALMAHKVISIPNGKPSWTPPREYSRDKRADYLFFAGNSEPRKNLLNAIKALELLFVKGRIVPLYIAGPIGWKNKSVAAYINGSRVREHIRFLGFCNDETLKLHYLQCKALLYPSLYEGFGLPILEALCLDCLVATSRGTVMEEIAGPCALYFDPLSPESIAKTIETMYSPTFDGNTILRNRESILSNFSWEVSAQKLLTVFKKYPSLAVNTRDPVTDGN